jgi:hypothetical protein
MSIDDSSIPKGVIVHKEAQTTGNSELSDLVMHWATDRPTDPGWYFLKQVKNYADGGTAPDKGENEVLVVKVFDNTVGKLMVLNTFVHKNAEWAGPIKEPIDA